MTDDAALELERPTWLHPKWQGHTHKFPKRLTGEVVTCTECGHPFLRESVEADRQAAN